MDDGHACSLTACEETHHLHIHQRHLVQIQYYPGSVTLQLCLQCFEMFRLYVANQPECRLVPISVPFNFACHRRCLFPGIYPVMTVDERSNCNNGTMRKLLTSLHVDQEGSAELWGKLPRLGTRERLRHMATSCGADLRLNICEPSGRSTPPVAKDGPPPPAAEQVEVRAHVREWIAR